MFPQPRWTKPVDAPGKSQLLASKHQKMAVSVTSRAHSQNTRTHGQTQTYTRCSSLLNACARTHTDTQSPASNRVHKGQGSTRPCTGEKKNNEKTGAQTRSNNINLSALRETLRNRSTFLSTNKCSVQRKRQACGSIAGCRIIKARPCNVS